MEEIKNEDWNKPLEPQFKPENKRVIAGITGILLGGLGVHKFILGYTNEGIIQIVLSLSGPLGQTERVWACASSKSKWSA